MITIFVGEHTRKYHHPTFALDYDIPPPELRISQTWDLTSRAMLHNHNTGQRELSADRAQRLPEPGGATNHLHVPGERTLARREQGLRQLCRRIFGWSHDRAALIDDVISTLLTAVARGTAIGLRGVTDPVPIAYALHRELLGPERPFVVCDPRRHEGEGSVRSPPSRKTGTLALRAAVGGSICVRSNRLPTDANLLSPSVRRTAGVPQLFVCMNSDDRILDMLCPPIPIPALAQRLPDLDRLITEYLAEATQALGVPRMRLSSRARATILWRVNSLADLEKVILRLVALKSAPSVSLAARQLGMAPVSLTRWAHRRMITEVLADTEYDNPGEGVED